MTGVFQALVIPVEGPVYEIRVGDTAGDLVTLQQAVGGFIEAVPVPRFIRDADQATAYINEEGKFTCLNDDGSVQINRRATDFMVPGVGLGWGDFIAGPAVFCGFDPRTGEHAVLPKAVVDRVRLIESEAG
jgi:hypothetical protein